MLSLANAREKGRKHQANQLYSAAKTLVGGFLTKLSPGQILSVAARCISQSERAQRNGMFAEMR
jgi:hypothetical protein